LERVFPIVETREAGDVYVQASKGILNGFILKELLPINLITDKFIDADIQAAKKLILSKDNDSIKTIALDIFKNPDQYLKTAKTGQVKGIISNAEEVIAGTPRAPFQGFILNGYGKSYKNDTSGIKFLFDNENMDQGFFQGKNILVIIQEIFFFMLQAHDSNAKGFTLMNIVAATVDFFLILGLFMLAHWLASPVRKRKFYGPSLIDVVNAVYKNHPLSNGRGSEEEPGEKKLVVQALSSQGNISDELRSNIRALKSGISQERCSVFDTLLTLAPFNPQNSAIRSKWHDFLFWLPWTGPVIARSPWFFARQRSFKQWETFNNQLVLLAKGINHSTNQNSFRQAYVNILKDFKQPSKAFDSSGDKTLAHLKEIEKSINTQFNEWSRLADLKKPVHARQLPWLTENDGEFSHLSSYSWNDDFKRIDWKATARSSNGEAKVRKYTGSASAQIDFLFDFRSIAKQHGQERIARDLVQALQILKHDHELKAITLIMPSGDLRNRNLNLKNTINRTELSRQIWSAITQEFEDDRAERQALAAHDLIFYTEEENRMYRHITRLTDFDHTDQQVKQLSAIATRSFNIYLIGVDDQAREEIMNLLPRTHQPFYWR
jgi:hypothetical protein